MYGPVLYIVLPIGGLYLAADILLLYSVFKGQGGGGDKGTMQNGNLYHEVTFAIVENAFKEYKFSPLIYIFNDIFNDATFTLAKPRGMDDI